MGLYSDETSLLHLIKGPGATVVLKQELVGWSSMKTNMCIIFHIFNHLKNAKKKGAYPIHMLF